MAIPSIANKWKYKIEEIHRFAPQNARFSRARSSLIVFEKRSEVTWKRNEVSRVSRTTALDQFSSTCGTVAYGRGSRRKTLKTNRRPGARVALQLSQSLCSASRKRPSRFHVFCMQPLVKRTVVISPRITIDSLVCLFLHPIESISPLRSAAVSRIARNYWFTVRINGRKNRDSVAFNKIIYSRMLTPPLKFENWIESFHIWKKQDPAATFNPIFMSVG